MLLVVPANDKKDKESIYAFLEALHAFDRDKLFGTVSVRLANEGEDILTLDNQQRKLDSSSLIITDDDKPVALAGVMGGLETEVTDETKNLLIESAYFDKVSIMNTSRKLNLISDASIRFERGIDRNIMKSLVLKCRTFTSLQACRRNL